MSYFDLRVDDARADELWLDMDLAILAGRFGATVLAMSALRSRCFHSPIRSRALETYPWEKP